MADEKKIEIETRPNHSGWHAFWGVIGAVIGLAVVAAVSYGGYWAYNQYAPPPVQTQVRSDLSKLRAEIAALKRNEPVRSEVPDGRAPKQVVDGFGPNGKLQRTVTDQDRYDPIDKLAAAVSATNDSVAGLKSSIEQQGQQIRSLSGNVQDLTYSVKKLDGRVDGIDTRVAALEKKQAAPAPAPQPAPTSEAAPAPAPRAQEPNPGPQSSVPAPARFAANVGGADPREVAAAAAAYKALGPIPGGGQINSHHIVSNVARFAPCANGHRRRIVAKVDDGTYTHYRTTCD